MIREAIILAGGLGTRLRSVVADLPKCMAPVSGLPFIHFIVAHLKQQGVERFIFSLGYKHEVISSYIDEGFAGIDKHYVIEEQLLGTGGAIKKAAVTVNGESTIIVNGDTLFNINMGKLADFHERHPALCTLALKRMEKFSRYGSVELAGSGEITAFHEKKFCETGNINGGVYALNTRRFLREELPDLFSFEKWLEDHAAIRPLYADVYENYFIDIGIPDDYQRFNDDYESISAKLSTGVTGTKLLPTAFFHELDRA
jgi:D-glycero-alpha-D-manno-heptose 1-phosphate guanylyltransferase